MDTDSATAQIDRRPLASRKLKIWQAFAARLVAQGVSPNAISIVGMLSGIWAGVCFASTSVAPPTPERVLWLVGAALVQLRLLCNMLDGMVAIGRKVTSPVGELYNEIPDRVSDLAILAGVGYAAGSSPRLGLLAAALAILTAYCRAAAKVAGAPQDYRGPMAKPHRMFVITLLSAACAALPSAWKGYIALHASSLPILALVLICIGCVITCVRRVLAAAKVLRLATLRGRDS